jgi:HSP20 family protein
MLATAIFALTAKFAGNCSVRVEIDRAQMAVFSALLRIGRSGTIFVSNRADTSARAEVEDSFNLMNQRRPTMALPTRVSRGNYNTDPYEAVQREFDSVLSRFLGGREAADGGNALAPYGVDVREDGDHFYVDAELPGFRKEEVDITLENQQLTITAERKSETGNGNGKKGDYLLRERRYTRFQRSFTLPPTVDEQTVNAKLNEGVLTIVLNKREETKPRKITVA